MTAESIVYTATGVWQWGGGPAMTLTHPEEWQSNCDPSGFVWEFPPSASARPALQALEHLWKRIRQELDIYRDHVEAVGDDARLQWTEWAEEWLEKSGAEMYHELRARIRDARPKDHAEMAEALRAAEGLVDVTHTSLRTPEEWDVVLDWARGILPSLRRAFKRFGRLPTVDVAMGEAETRQPAEPLSAIWLQAQRSHRAEPTAIWGPCEHINLTVCKRCDDGPASVAA